MSFALVKLESQLMTVIMKKDIKYCHDKCYCKILNKLECVTIIGCHEDYMLLNDICKQDNLRTMTVNIARVRLDKDITPENESTLSIDEPPKLKRRKDLKPRLSTLTMAPRRLLFDYYDEDVSKDLRALFPIQVPQSLLLDIDDERDVYEDIPKVAAIHVKLPKNVSTTNRIDEDKYVEKSVSTDICIAESSTLTIPSLVALTRPRQSPIHFQKTRRNFNKGNFCKFCQKKRTCLSRHITAMHADEPSVREFITMSKSNPKKRFVLSQIRRDGNFEKMLEDKSKLVPARTLNMDIDPLKYVVCANCKIIITKEALRRHCRLYCEKAKGRQYSVGSFKASKALTESIDDRACNILKNFIFTTLREGIVKETIRFDHMLIIYGNELCYKYRSQHHYPMIRNRLILMTKFLIEMKNCNKTVDDFKSILKPQYFNEIVGCINKFGKYDEVTGVYAKPTLPTALGTAIKYCIHLYVGECIKDGFTDDIKENAKDLLHLLNTSLPAHVNKTASESLLRQKRQKPVILPSTEDIKKLNIYVLEQRKLYFEELQKGFQLKSWLGLSKFTLISILIFNRRRPGELQRTYVSDLNSLESVSKDNRDIVNSLSENDQYAIENYMRFTIRGKLARGVPVLLHKSMNCCLKKMLEYRKDAGVHPNNPYLFGLPQTKETAECKIVYRHLLANNLIRDYAKACGATNPRTLRATQLRKHIATKSVSLNLNSHEINNLQTFLGHADKVHREYYRQPIAVDDIVNMSKLLLIAQGDVSQKKSPISQKISPISYTENVSRPSTSYSPSLLPDASHILHSIRERNENCLNDPENDSDYVPSDGSDSSDGEDSSKFSNKKND